MSLTTGAFFSYCRDDAAFALRLAEDLKAAGGNVWLDQLDILAGDRWDRSVEDALNASSRLLVLLSPRSVTSTNVMDEVSFALEEKKVVIPILYQDCAVPFRLRRVHYVDFRGDYDRALQELLKTLRHGEPASSATGSPMLGSPPADATTAGPTPLVGGAAKTKEKGDVREAAREQRLPTRSGAKERSPVRPAQQQHTVGKAAPPDSQLTTAGRATHPDFDRRPSPTFQSGFVASAALIMLVMRLGYRLPMVMLLPMMKQLGLTAEQLGMTFAADTVGVMLGCVVGGALGDRVGRRLILLAIFPMFGLVTLLMAQASSATHFIGIRLVMGFGMGSAIPNVVALSYEYVSSKRQPLAVTLTIAGLFLGNVLVSFSTPSILGAIGWQPLLVACGLASLLLVIVVLKFLPESHRYREQRHRGRSRGTILTPEVRRGTIALGCAFFCCLVANSSQNHWYILGVDRGPLTTGLRVAGVAAVVLAIVGAAGASRVGDRTILLIGAAASALIAILALVVSESGLFVPLTLLAATMGAVHVLLYPLAARSFPTLSRATGVGFVAALGYGGTFVRPYNFAEGGIAMIMVSTAVALGLLFLSILMTRRNGDPRVLELDAPATLETGRQ